MSRRSKQKKKWKISHKKNDLSFETMQQNYETYKKKEALKTTEDQTKKNQNMQHKKEKLERQLIILNEEV